MKRRLISFLVWLLLPFFVSAQRPDTSGSAVMFKKLMDGINSRHVNWVKTSAKTVNEKNSTETETRNMVSQYAVLGNMGDADIEALAFLVMMQAAKDAQEDLKAIMARMKSINEQKAKQREALAKMKEMREKNEKMLRARYDSFTQLLRKNPDLKINQRQKTAPTKEEVDDLRRKMEEELKSNTEMAHEKSLQLQMLTDRISKIMAIISNIYKKITRSVEEILKNLTG